MRMHRGTHTNSRITHYGENDMNYFNYLHKILYKTIKFFIKQ